MQLCERNGRLLIRATKKNFASNRIIDFDPSQASSSYLISRPFNTSQSPRGSTTHRCALKIQDSCAVTQHEDLFEIEFREGSNWSLKEND